MEEILVHVPDLMVCSIMKGVMGEKRPHKFISDSNEH